MRKVLYGAVALFLLALAAVIFGPSLIDWNRYKPRIAAEIYAATGRVLEVEGDLSLSLLPRPSLSAERVTLSNEIGRDEPMVWLESLQMHLKFLPLLSGDLDIEQMVLIRPQILLERYEDGTHNWDFATPDTPLLPEAAESDATGDSEVPAVTLTELEDTRGTSVMLDNLVVREGTLIYRDIGQEIEERLDSVEGELIVGDASGPFSSNGRFVIRNVPVAFQGNMAAMTAGAASPLSLRIGFPNAETELQYSGSLILQGERPELRGSLQAMSGNLAALLERMEIWDPAPDMLGQRMVLRGELRGHAEGLAAPDLQFELGQETANVALRVDFGEEPYSSLRVAMQQLNLDRLFAAAQPPTPNGNDRQSGAPSLGDLLRLPDTLRGDLDITVDALIYRERPVRQLRLNAGLEDGVWNLRHGQALLPGGADLVVTGALREDEIDGPKFDGDLEITADNLRGTLDWLGLPMERVPGDRLRRMTLYSGLSGSEGEITLSDLTAEVDTSSAEGGIAIALRSRPALGIGLTIDHLNLDAYRPQPESEEAADDSETHRRPNLLQVTATLLNDLPETLRGFDANFDLHLASMVLAEARLQNLSLDATLHNGNLDLRGLVVEDIAGAGRGEMSGNLDARQLPAVFDLALNLDLPNPAHLAQHSDLEREDLQDLGPIEATTRTRGTMEQMDLDATLALLGGRLEAVGNLTPAFAEAEQGGAPRLLETGLDLELVAEHPDLAGLFGALPQWLPSLPAESGPLAVSARIVGVPQQLSAETFSGRFGPLGLSGSGSITTGGERPRLRAELETAELPLDFLAILAAPLLSEEAEEGPAEASDEAEDAAPASLWSRQALPLAWMQRFDAEIRVNSQSWLLAEALSANAARLDLTLEEGALDLREMSGQVFGGRVGLSGGVTSTDEPGLAFNLLLQAEEVAGHQLVTRLLDEESDIRGPLSFAAEIAASGESPAALVASLSGEGRIAGRLAHDGIARTDEENDEVPESDLLGFWALDLESLQDPRTAATGLLSAFPGVPGTLSGGFHIEGGRLRSEELRLDGPGAWVEMTGGLGLPRLDLDFLAELYREEDSDAAEEETEASPRPYLSVHFLGTWQEPRTALGGSIFDPPPLPRVELPDYLAPLPIPEPEPEPEDSANTRSDDPPGSEALRRVIEDLREEE